MEFLTDNIMNKRNFITKGFKALTTALGLYFIHNRIEGKDHNETDKVKMLTPDGKLVWVDKSVLNSKSPAPPISNKSLRSWIKSPKR